MTKEYISEVMIGIPTYNRPEDVAQSVRAWASHMYAYKYHWPIVVFDDSQNDIAHAVEERIGGVSSYGCDVLYVGPDEKVIMRHMLTRELKGIVEPSFIDEILTGPKYGENRLFTLLYSFGGYLLSFDDDIRPYNYEMKSRDEQKYPGVMIPSFTINTMAQSISEDVIGAYVGILGKRSADLSKTRIRFGQTYTENREDSLLQSVSTCDVIPVAMQIVPGEMSGNSKVVFAMAHKGGPAIFSSVLVFGTN